MGLFNGKAPEKQDPLFGEDTRWRQKHKPEPVQQTRRVVPMKRVSTLATRAQQQLDDHMAKQRLFKERHLAAIAAGEDPKAAHKRIAREMWPEWYSEEQL